MTKYALIAALSALLGLGGYAWLLQSENAALSASLAQERALRVNAEIGAAELSRFVREQRHRDRNLMTIIQHIATGEFDNADTPLDPDLVRALECLRRPDCDFTADPD
jgi:hypothetical protein